VRQLHDRTVVILFSLMMMDRLVPRPVHGEGEAGSALRHDHQRDERVKNPEYGGAVAHVAMKYKRNLHATTKWASGIEIRPTTFAPVCQRHPAPRPVQAKLDLPVVPGFLRRS
jgi:hypothetical protein